MLNLILTGCKHRHVGFPMVKVKSGIRSEINARYQPDFMDTARSLPMLATLLDHQYKRLPFLTTEQRKAAHEKLEVRIDEITLRLSVSTNDTPTPESRKLDFCSFDTDYDDAACDELESYLADKPSQECDPLEWWNKNELKYTKISMIVRRVLAVPSTSVPSERIFSAAGLLINKLKNRLSSDIVDSIIFLNKNSIPRDIKKDTTESDFANVIGM